MTIICIFQTDFFFFSYHGNDIRRIVVHPFLACSLQGSSPSLSLKMVGNFNGDCFCSGLVGSYLLHRFCCI